MENIEFHNMLKNSLLELSKEQLVRFIWITGLKIIPFLGIKGNFDFWDTKNRQAHLYRIFSSVDFCELHMHNICLEFISKNKISIENILQQLNRVGLNENFKLVDYIVFSLAYFNRATFSFLESDLNRAISYRAARVDCIDYTLTGVGYIIKALNYCKATINFEENTIDDLNKIKRNEKYLSQNPNLFEGIWNSFIAACKETNNQYWGYLYQDIFNNGFLTDEETLIKRLAVPEEIKAEGAAAVAYFLVSLEKGDERFNESRIIILGDKGAGKTSITRKLINPASCLPSTDESTIGIEIKLWKIDKGKINVRIWDFAGHTITHAVHQFFLSERCLYIIVYNGREDHKDRLTYWLNQMKNYGGNSKAIILINMHDEHEPDIPQRHLVDEFPQIDGFYSFSIKDDMTSLMHFRNKIQNDIRNSPTWNRQSVPTSFYQVKDALEKIFNNENEGQEYISKEMFFRIAMDKNAINPDLLLSSLNALGISLWYPQMEEYNTLILNPNWISYGVYKIINWLKNEEKYQLRLLDLSIIFIEDIKRYPPEKHEFLYKLLQHYELAYQTKECDCLIIPHLLHEDRPINLPLFEINESLILRFKADQPLPTNTISRFIVRHNKEIKINSREQLVWRYGAIFEDEKGNIALVRENDREISISVKGETRAEYFSKLRDSLNIIFDSYKSKKPELEYRIEQLTSFAGKEPVWVSETVILNHARAGKTTYFDCFSNEEISVHRMISALHIKDSTVYIHVGNTYDNSKNNSTNYTFNFYDCNIDLQGKLNDLAQLLMENGNKEEAQELHKTAELLQTEEGSPKEEIKRKGVFNRVKRIIEELGDENSKLHNSIEGLKYGIRIAQDIGQTYNNIAQWAGLPQVPQILLKKEKVNA